VTAKLYVGNVSYDASGEDLSVLFAEIGTVLASRVIVDRVTGKSRGFGFVEMANDTEAEAAIGRFNGFRLMGRSLLVHLAHDNRELSRRAREAKARQQREIRPTIHHTLPIDTRSVDTRAQELRDRMDRMRRPLRPSMYRDRAL
jgi:RNA recognition motif-containing protein